jgi:hypothetical protein
MAAHGATGIRPKTQNTTHEFQIDVMGLIRGQASARAIQMSR